MKKIRTSKVLVFTMLVSILLMPYNVMASGTDSDVTIVINDDKPTNQDINITVETSDDSSGIKEIILPNGEKVVKANTIYTVTENGSYIFKVSDNAGNETEGTVVIDNIDKKLPTLELTSDKTKPTNQDVVITATASDTDSGIKEIILPDGSEVKEESKTYIVSENGSYTFKAIDNAGNEVEKTIEVTNIDKVPPVITVEPYETNWINQDIIVKVSTDKGELNQESYTFTENGTFTFVAKDEAGNVTEETVEITNIDKVKPTMKIIVGE